MINNNSYRVAERPRHLNLSGYETARMSNRLEENSPTHQDISRMKKSAILMGNQPPSHRIENSYIGLPHSPRMHGYNGNFSIPRTSNPNALSQAHNQNQISLLNPPVMKGTQPITESNLVRSVVSDHIQQKLLALEEKIEKVTFTVQKHSSKLSSFGEGEMEALRTILMDFNVVKKGSEEQTRLQSFSSELTSIKHQLKEIEVKSAAIFQERIGNFQNYVLKTFALNEKEIVDKVNGSENIKKLEKLIGQTFQLKLSAIQQGIQNFKKQVVYGYQFDQRIKQLESRFERQAHQEKRQQYINKSLLKSNNTPIVLKYIQNFRLKWGRKNADRDISIAETVYQIDLEGYLLDEENHYLLNAQGVKLKLEEKHISLLRQYEILK